VTDLATRARTLLDLHTAPEILVLANVWDVVSAQVVGGTEGVRALATASHGIAATFGYEDGENIPLDLHLDMVGRIAAAVDLPVSMDMEAGYGDAGETARRAMAVGVVGGNLEDQMRPLEEAVAAVEAVVRAGRDAGIDFVLNARTDVFVRAAEGPTAGSWSPRRSAGAAPSSRPGAGGVRPAAGGPRGDRGRRRRAWAATG
jgi:2-methylisocitrate lyase-like PEP mutase family enzyme